MLIHRPFSRLLPLAALIIAWSAAPAQADDEASVAISGHLLQADLSLNEDNYLRAAQELRRAALLSDDPDIARRATRTAFSFGFNAEALRSAVRWLELEPDSNEAKIYAAQLKLRTGNIRESRKLFEQLLDESPDPPDQQLLSLLPAFVDEDPETALKLMRQLARDYEDSAIANYAVGAMALQADELEEAAERARKAIEIDPEWLKAKLLLARTKLLSGDREGAIDYTARIIGDDPAPDPDARMELALMYLAERRDDDALSQVNQVLLEQPSRTDALRLMAIINFRQENLDAAWDDFEDLLASGRYTMDALFYMARIADYREETERAIRLYSQVVSGDNVIPSQQRASVLLATRQDDPEMALQRLDEFADQYPRYAVDLVAVRARLLTLLKREDEALTAFDQAATYRPDDLEIVLGRAALLLQAGKLDESIAAYRKAMKRWPDNATLMNALGYTLADRTTRYREAERLIRRALEDQPYNPAIIDSMGWVLFKRGKPAEALPHLEKAYELYPDPEVAAHLVEVLAALDRGDEALELLVAAEEKDPEDELLADVRKRVFP